MRCRHSHQAASVTRKLLTCLTQHSPPNGRSYMRAVSKYSLKLQMHPSPRKKQKIRICLTLFTERMVFTPVYTMESWLPRAVCSPTLSWSERWFLSLNYWLHKHARRSDKQHFRWANDLPAIYLGGKYAVAAALSLQDSLVISKTIVQPLISLLSLQYMGTENRPDLR